MHWHNGGPHHGCRSVGICSILNHGRPTMSDRDRIAAIISTHDCFDYGGRVECRCGDRHEELPLFESVQAWGEHVADAVIYEIRNNNGH